MEASRSSLDGVTALRASFLGEGNFQVRYEACHHRGWADHYLLTADGMPVGYGAIKGQEIADRDTVFEFYLAPPSRAKADAAFRALLEATAPSWIECQSNDRLLFAMLCTFAGGIAADTILFEDHAETNRLVPGARFRKRVEAEPVFEHRAEPVGDYVLETAGEVIATGGFLTHYNPPFADLHLEVRSDCRGKGFGFFLLQELKKQCYRSGRVPAARCSIANEASKAALLKAGMRVCGFMLKGAVSR